MTKTFRKKPFSKALSIVGVLADDADPMVSVMKVDKAPPETYADVGELFFFRSFHFAFFSCRGLEVEERRRKAQLEKKMIKTFSNHRRPRAPGPGDQGGRRAAPDAPGALRGRRDQATQGGHPVRGARDGEDAAGQGGGEFFSFEFFFFSKSFFFSFLSFDAR